jgi:hypothetical protein
MRLLILTVMGVMMSQALGSEELNLTLKSGSFADHSRIPVKYVNKGVRDGENLSPQLHWENIPAGTQTLVLTCIDKHRIAGNWVHWMVINISPAAQGIPEGASLTKNMPAQAVELVNSFNQAGYGGPQPPPGSRDHEYVFTLYALKSGPVQLKGRYSEAELLKMIEKSVIAEASFSGFFGR